MDSLDFFTLLFLKILYCENCETCEMWNLNDVQWTLQFVNDLRENSICKSEELPLPILLKLGSLRLDKLNWRHVACQ